MIQTVERSAMVKAVAEPERLTPAAADTYSSVTPRHIRVIGVPLDLGQSRRGG